METTFNELGQTDRVLWFTDTFGDHNGVAMVLQSIHREIKERDLPIDILVCSNTIKSDRNLIVIKPISEFNIPFYPQQPLRLPNYITIQSIFRKGRYNRIICSTEGPMGFAALYIRKIYSVKSYFYLHTDWVTFGKQVMAMEEAGLRRLQRLMRIYYNRFDGIFVLNSEQQEWLTGELMRLDRSRIFMTAHWADEVFSNLKNKRSERFRSIKRDPVVLFAGRVSKEKGVFELPEIFRKAKQKVPELKMIIAGTGPAEKELKNLFPEAEFLGWVDQNQLSEIFHRADLFLFPSRFDTFGCVVIEAFSCGLPVIAYNTKGPKDIIQDHVNGFLVESPNEIADRTIEYFSDENMRNFFKKSAVIRANDYSSHKILQQLLKDIEINTFFLSLSNDAA